MTPDDFLRWSDILPEPTLLVTTDGRLLAANRAVRRLGCAPAALAGRPLADLVTDPPDRVAEYLRACARSGDLVVGALALRVDGQSVPCRCEGALIRPPADPAAPRHLLLRLLPKDPAMARFVVLTEKAEALAQEVNRRRQAEAELRDADRRKTKFLGILAHELRNPLVPIVNWLHILQSPGVTPAMDSQARVVIARQVGQMSRLVDDLVDISRLLRDKIGLRKERLELAPAVTAAVETVRPQIDTHHHELSVALPPEPMYLDADPVRLSQMVGILLSNAAKYTDPGGRIELTASRDGNTLVLQVCDSGIGIPAEALDRIFEPFVHEERVPGRHVGGLGVGLTLVKKLAELHGGTVTAQSEGLGHGSRFTVRLPLAG